MKTRLNFTIEENISDEFKKICNNECINMSKLIERFMEDFIKKNIQYNNVNKNDVDN